MWWSMTLYWVLGLIVDVVALVFVVLRIRGVTRSPEEDVDIPSREADTMAIARHPRVEFACSC